MAFTRLGFEIVLGSVAVIGALRWTAALLAQEPGQRVSGPVAAQAAAGEPAARPGRAHWAFEPVVEPRLPQPRDPGWCATAVDHFVLDQLEPRGLQPSSAANRRTFMRRLMFDLVGLPPKPDEVDEFARDNDPAACIKLVDRLLASPQYGERWARHWLDVARYADSKGYVYADREEERYPFSYVYRDYVVRAFNEDRPYDQFLIEQIAADCLGDAIPAERLAALGFLTLGRRFVNNLHDIIDDRLEVIFRGTQGLSIGCARCHDHKYDPIPIEDYYSLYGVMAGSTERVVDLGGGSPAGPAEQFFNAELDARLQALEAAYASGREELSRRLRRQVEMYLAAVLEAPSLPGSEFYVILRDPEDLNPVIVHRWKSWLLKVQASGAWHPVFGVWLALADLPADQFARRAAGLLQELLAGEDPRRRVNSRLARAFTEAPEPTSMRDVAARYAAALKQVDEQWNQAVAEAARRNAAPPEALDDPEDEELRQVLYAADAPTSIPAVGIYEVEPFFDEAARVRLAQRQMKIDQWHLRANVSAPRALVLAETGAPVEPRVFLRGDPRRMGAVVPRQNLALLAGERRARFEQGSGRLELARSIASPRNPLTARVMVNRMWLHHVGTGLVRTPSDFGARAEPPSHPKLLDYLANLLVREGWSLKAVQRQIVLSSTYRQQSADRPEARLIDPENRLLWRMNARRLDWEALRDTLLATAGNLDQRMGGRSVEIHGSEPTSRRTLYGYIDRQNFPALFRNFDAANPDQHTPQRHVTTIPQQALYLLNSPFLARQARGLARRAAQDAGKTPRALIVQMVRAALQREPAPRELEEMLAFVAEREAPLPARPPEAAMPAAPPRWQPLWGAYDLHEKCWKQCGSMAWFRAGQWQPEESFPSGVSGLACLTRAGGHAGPGPAGCVAWRFAIETAGTISVKGTVKHQEARGDGIVAVIVSRSAGELARAAVRQAEAALELTDLAVPAGDLLDFVVCPQETAEGDEFQWSPEVVLKPADHAPAIMARAADDFAGPPPETAAPLLPLEELAQVLLLSNELSFVD